LEPAANANLSEFLENYREIPDRDTSPEADTLRRSFGCLVSGLAYIHRKGIRHKDIKPQNILVNGKVVIYTDFGASKAFNVASDSTTEGPPDFLSRKYCAPEVLKHEQRNYASDVYSLGRVFIETLSALTDRTLDANQLFSAIMDELHEYLESASIPSELSSLPSIITSMTLLEMRKREKASHLSSSICTNTDLCCELCEGLRTSEVPRILRKQSSWKWSPAQRRYYLYLYDGGIVIETKWSDEPSSQSGDEG
jgi:serine/threonine protein kinase